MILPDVNVLVYAFREDSPDHEGYARWLQERLDGSEPVALADFVLSGFLRIVTHPRIFHPVTPLNCAVDFVEAVKAASTSVRLRPSERHWSVFLDLCAQAGARGNAIPDAYLAALAIEQGCTLYTADHGFARYPGLRWFHPLRSKNQ